MTIADLTRRIFAYWWVIIITGTAFSLLLFPWTNQVQYVGTITVGINLNDPTLSSLEESSLAYVESFEALSTYIDQRFSAIDIQNIVSQESGLNIPSLVEGKPFYEVTLQGAGFSNISYKTPHKDQAERFTQGVKVAYTQIVEEWNESRQSEFRITPMTQFTSSVVATQKPVQFQLLPIISGILVGIVVIVILPLPKTKTVYQASSTSISSTNTSSKSHKQKAAKK